VRPSALPTVLADGHDRVLVPAEAGVGVDADPAGVDPPPGVLVEEAVLELPQAARARQQKRAAPATW